MAKINFTKSEAGYKATVKAGATSVEFNILRRGTRFQLERDGYPEGKQNSLTGCRERAEEILETLIALAAKEERKTEEASVPVPITEAEEIAHTEKTADRLLTEERKAKEAETKAWADKLIVEYDAEKAPAHRAAVEARIQARLIEAGAANISENESAPCPKCGTAQTTFPCWICGHGSVEALKSPAPKPAPVAAPSSSAVAAIRSASAPKASSGPPHVVVTARAGTGKTTTLVQGLKTIWGGSPRDMIVTDREGRKSVKTIEPSTQQQAVWDAIALSKGASSVCFVAFNRSIANELKARVPAGCDAMTMHGMGFKAVNRAFKLLGGDRSVNEYRVDNIIEEITGTDIRDLRRTRPVVLFATKKLVSHVKANLVPLDVEDGADAEKVAELLTDLAHHYDVDLADDATGRDYSGEVFALVPKVIARCLDVARDGYVDYDDMVWLPVALGLPMFQYDLLMGDEVQDWNRGQQALARKAGRRLILCGDDKQAIYGFTGADSESIPRMSKELAATERGCVNLPLTVTRRCGKAIVAEAKKIVPDFDAFETNGEGRILTAAFRHPEGRPAPTYHSLVEDGDMVLCRVNAPLVSECFRFLRAGRRANIQGRDIGKKLIGTVKKVAPDDRSDVPALVGKIDDWRAAEVRKESAKRNPNENYIINVEDTADCLGMFCEGMATVDAVIVRIEGVFTDDKNTPGIKLSSVHKAKGTEAERVFFLRPKGAECPHPMAKKAWAREQEMNLLYVGITRAIRELVFVS